MSGIPSWAVKGAKVVLVDGQRGIEPYDTDAKVGDVCEILEVRRFGDTPACRVREVSGRWWNNANEYCRLSRFRPLVEDTDDNEVEARIFNAKHKRQPVGEDA